MTNKEQTLIERLDEIKANSVTDEQFKKLWGKSIDEGVDEIMNDLGIAESEPPLRTQIQNLLNRGGDCSITEELLIRNGFKKLKQPYKGHNELSCVTDDGYVIEIDLTDRNTLVGISKMYDGEGHTSCYVPFPTGMNMFNLELFVCGVKKELVFQ